MKTPGVKLRVVALPAEHGSWALVLEPIVLGLLLAPSRLGLCIALGSFACFLTRHPLKVVFGDRRRPHKLRRTALAGRLAIFYALVAASFFAVSMLFAQKRFLIPLLFALPFMLVQLAYDARGYGRKLLPELAGAIGVGAITTAIMIAARWPNSTAYALWFVVACRNAPTILYLRTRLSGRREEHTRAVNLVVLLVQLTALASVGVLAWWRLVPALAVVAFSVLALRAVVGLSSTDAPTPKKLGIAEFAFGALTIFAIAGGYALGW